MKTKKTEDEVLTPFVPAPRGPRKPRPVHEAALQAEKSMTPVLPQTDVLPDWPSRISSLPALSAEQKTTVLESYMNALFILGEEAINAVRVAMESCTEPKDVAKIAFGVLDRIGLSTKAVSSGDGTGGGEIAGAAIKAAIEGMAKISGIEPASVQEAVRAKSVKGTFETVIPVTKEFVDDDVISALEQKK